MLNSNTSRFRILSFVLILVLAACTIIPVGMGNNNVYAQETESTAPALLEEELFDTEEIVSTPPAIEPERESEKGDLNNDSDVSQDQPRDDSGALDTYASHGTISGRVVDEDNDPIEGATAIAYMYLSGEKDWEWLGSADTDSNGVYTIYNLPAGKYKIRFVDYYNYDPMFISEFYNNVTTIDAATNVTVKAGANTPGINASLDYGGWITGNVTDNYGMPLEDVEISLYEYSSIRKKWMYVYYTTTDEDGDYYFGGIDSKNYRIEFSHDFGKYVNKFYLNSKTLASATNILGRKGDIVENINAKLTPRIGWYKISWSWYYFNASGEMQKGWQFINNKWYYLGEYGDMYTGWKKSNKKWYYLTSSGAMNVGWIKVSKKWYYMDSNGAMLTGWQKIKKKWYYMNSSGKMLTGYQNIGKKTYRFKSNGVWAG